MIIGERGGGGGVEGWGGLCERGKGGGSGGEREIVDLFVCGLYLLIT